MHSIAPPAPPPRHSAGRPAPAPEAAESATAAKPKIVARPQPQKTYAFLSDAQIAGIKDRLRLTSDQEYYWPGIEQALRAISHKIQAERQVNPKANAGSLDPDSAEVQQLKSAAMPLLFQLREDQKDEVRKLVPIAEELQIFICIENVWNDMLITPLEMARYIDEINSPWVGSYFDIGNSVRFGWPEHWIAALGKRIKQIDIKEYSRKLMNTKGPGAGFNLKIGDPGGDCDWPRVLAALDAVGYHGWASA